MATVLSKFHLTFPSFLRWMETHGKRSEDGSVESSSLTPNDVIIEGFLDFNTDADRKKFIQNVEPNWVNPLFSLPSEKTNDNSFTEPPPNSSISSEPPEKKNFHLIGAFRHSQLIWVKASYQWFQDIASDNLIKSIHYNHSLYLCLNQVNQIYDTSVIANSFFEFQGAGIKVGVIDTGIDQTHPDLQNQVEDIINTTDEDMGDLNGHGTMLAGIIAGTGHASNKIFHGIAPKVQLIDIKVFNKEGSSKLADVLLALDLILDRTPEKRPHILLFGGTTAVPWSEDDLLSQYCSLISDQNILIVCPSGNFGPDPGFIPSPAGHPFVICVGSVDFENKLTFFSGRSNDDSSRQNNTMNIKPNVFFPGTEVIVPSIFSSYIGTQIPNSPNYILVSGTSISAAIATGLLSILKEAFPKESISNMFKFFCLPSNQKFDLVKILQDARLFFPKPLSYRKLVRISGLLATILFGLSLGLYYLINYLY